MIFLLAHSGQFLILKIQSKSHHFFFVLSTILLHVLTVRLRDNVPLSLCKHCILFSSTKEFSKTLRASNRSQTYLSILPKSYSFILKYRGKVQATSFALAHSVWKTDMLKLLNITPAIILFKISDFITKQ